jgi:hypothetical protein
MAKSAATRAHRIAHDIRHRDFEVVQQPARVLGHGGGAVEG